MESGGEIRSILKEKGLKATPQRIAVYNSMLAIGHASADMVEAELKKTCPSLTLATIYNVLESFVGCGLLKRRFSSNNKMYFDVNTYEHMHIYCEDTGSFVDYEDDTLMKLIEEYMKDKHIDGFDIKGIEVQLIGSRS